RHRPHKVAQLAPANLVDDHSSCPPSYLQQQHGHHHQCVPIFTAGGGGSPPIRRSRHFRQESTRPEVRVLLQQYVVGRLSNDTFPRWSVVIVVHRRRRCHVKN
ncbi:unnamed protein product, partial [Ectocarpus sp. 13 AM-2016]